MRRIKLRLSVAFDWHIFHWIMRVDHKIVVSNAMEKIGVRAPGSYWFARI